MGDLEMVALPPWEWVDGDPVHAVRFGVVTGQFTGALIATYGLVVLSALSLLSAPLGVLEIVFSALMAPALAFDYLYPRHFAVIPRLGISPVGLRIPMPLHTVSVPWSKITVVGTDYIAVVWGLTDRCFHLTELQSERLHRFLRYR